MKNIRIGLIIGVLLLFSLFSLTAQEYTVEFVDGYAEAKFGGVWDELYIGDELGLSDSIRLDSATVVELELGGVTITLTKKGTYSLRDLHKQVAQRDDVGLGSLVGNKLNTMFGGDSGPLVPTAVGGVRGDEVTGGDDFGWIESEVDEIIDSGIAALERNEMDSALDLFNEAYDYSLDEAEENKSLFYIGYTYSLLGEIDAALTHVNDIMGEPEEDIYAPYYLLKGKLLIETFDFSGATSFLLTYDDSYGTAEDEQVIYFLLGYAYKSLNDASNAETYLKKSYNIAQSSDVGKVAFQLLNN